ncbi:MBL fold metallo-hydrolase [Lancefieldella rimae]|uniref:MBL fold metallo-hydrolase n=1 Tax=Lancefieldella rimae TaxID=1383 RepID=UPI0028804903|nr:MBL fold metallo-hydrolase [Lancefieldella rimae]
MTPQIHLHILASGSSGNAAIVEGPQTSILIDCGLSRRELLRRSQELDIDTDRIAAVFITHEHSDHVSGLHVFAKHFDGPIFATSGTAHILSQRSSTAGVKFSLISTDVQKRVGEISVQAFSTSHDVAEPVGFRFSLLGEKNLEIDSIGYCTDTGILTDDALTELTGARILALESNHDEHMLATGPYPQVLKERVGGPYGHLSNEQAASALAGLIRPNTRTVVGMHLSRENNRPSLAVRTLAAALGAEPVNDTYTQAKTAGGLQVLVAGQDWPMSVL